MTSAIHDYQSAERYVNGLIMGPPSPPPGTSPQEIRSRAIARLKRLRAFLGFLGDPQTRYETIHVAGTSGKGSTCAFTAGILTRLGYRTGLHVSPYLQAATEKLQIGDALVTADRYARLVADMKLSVEEWTAAGNERPNYGEFWVAMTFRYFAEENVDVAVIEVGAGGRFDVTNVIDPRVAAVTSIGFDHMLTLGSTIPEIAWHKAGIIKPGSVAVTSVQGIEALSVIRDECRVHNVPLVEVVAGETYRDTHADGSGTSFVDSVSGHRMKIGLPGKFQAANGATALAIVRAFTAREIDASMLASGLASTRFPGRMEVVQEHPHVVLDGAHNPDKIASLRESLELMFPGTRRILVFGAIESKSYSEMFSLIDSGFDVIVVTEPRVEAKPATPASEYELGVGSCATLVIEPDPRRALNRAFDIARDDDLIVVTGSLYLVGNVREYWYPLNAILAQATSWPDPIASSTIRRS